MSDKKISYGLDIAGYSTGKTALARAEKESDKDSIEIRIIEKHIFNKKYDSKDSIDEIGKKESDLIKECLKAGSIFIDVPIDLQGLPDPDNPVHIWQLTMRPVDKAFDALPALADRIGVCVSRFRYIMRYLNPECLGKQLQESQEHKLYETYPAASLECMGLNSKEYKGGKGAIYTGSTWEGISKIKKKEDKDKKLAKLLKQLEWSASPNTSINEDEFDAALCAVIGVSTENDLLHGEGLNLKINEILGTMGFEGPKGYVILKERPVRVNIGRE